MLQSHQAILDSYNPDWPRMAASHSEQLRALGPNILIVHHIGSTAVPGLAAKPIIDLMPLVADLAELDRGRGRIEGLGYNWRGEFGIPGRRFCILSGETGRSVVHLHFFKTDSPDVERHIAFRDYLRAHPEAAIAYQNEKRRARDLHPNDSNAYCDEKAEWVRKTEAAALIWFSAAKTP